MKHFHRAAAILVCLFIIAAPFTRCFYSYADSTTDNWQNVTTNEELVEAFRYYCKSRDLTIDGSAADVVTTFTTKTFNNICNAIGIDVTALQAHLKKETDGNNVRFLFDSTGITAYNRIFSQFLQDNDLEVGDSANQNDNKLYDGKEFNNSLLTIINTSSGGQNTYDYPASVIISRGTYYQYNSDQIANAIGTSNKNVAYTVLNNTFNFWGGTGTTSYGGNTYRYWTVESLSVKTQLPEADYPTSQVYDGYVCIFYNMYYQQYFIGVYNHTSDGKERIYPRYQITTLNDNNTRNVVVFLTTNNTTINNNNYEGDTIINNNGTQETDEPIGGTPPDWNLGGGQGTAEDGNGNTWNITWPSFELPDLNIDWSIHGLSEKFPFSIPFDLVSLVTVLSAEPEAPQFTGTVDLKVYQWNYDLDFSQFDNVAAVFRTAETLLFVFGLIMITRKIIRG